MNVKKKKFLNIPEYPGGKSSFQKYIADNLIYPEEALKNSIEGIVYLSAEVDDNGIIGEIRIEKGLGYGCDEEAIRLIRGVHFGGVKNVGVRLKTRKKFRIQFTIKDKLQNQNQKVNYQLKKQTPQNENKSPLKPRESVYSYSIRLNVTGSDDNES